MATVRGWWRPFRRITRVREPRTGFVSARHADAGGRQAGDQTCESDIYVRIGAWLPGGAERPAGRSGAGWRGLVARMPGRERDAPLGDKRLAKRLVDSAHGATFSLPGGGGYDGSDRVLPLTVHAMNLPRSRQRIFWQRTRNVRSGQTRGSVHSGRYRPELRDACTVRRLGRRQPDQRENSRASYDDGGGRYRPPSGSAEA